MLLWNKTHVTNTLSSQQQTHSHEPQPQECGKDKYINVHKWQKGGHWDSRIHHWMVEGSRKKAKRKKSTQNKIEQSNTNTSGWETNTNTHVRERGAKSTKRTSTTSWIRCLEYQTLHLYLSANSLEIRKPLMCLINTSF